MSFVLMAPAANLIACLVQAGFLLVAWKGNMLLFWSRSGKLTRSKICFPLNRRDSSFLFWLALLYFFSPFYSLGQNYCKSSSSSLSSSDWIILVRNSFLSLVFPGQKILSPTPKLQKYFKSHFPSDLEKLPPFCLLISYTCRWSLKSLH